MHRESGFGARRMFLFLAPLIFVTVLGAMFVRSQQGAEDGVTPAAFTGAPATPATTDAEATSTPAPTKQPSPGELPSLGTKRGTVTLAGPKRAKKGAFVVFVLDGPKRVVRTDSSAPFAVKVNTKALPNGQYTLNVMWARRGAESVAYTKTLRVYNPKPKPSAEPADPGSGSGGSSNGGSGGSSSGSGGLAAQVLSLTNAERADAGCKPLRANAKLTAAAQAHSSDMAAKDYFSHNSKNGDSPFTRMKEAGYSFSAAAENIAMGQPTAKAVMKAWMNSPGHKANILNCTYTELGVGYATRSGTPYWTQDFGKPL